MPGLYHKEIGAGKDLALLGYGIISLVDSLDSLIQSIPEAARRVVDAIVVAQIRHELLPLRKCKTDPPSPVIVALSGGADSVCLLHALWLIAPYWGLALHAAHLDHGYRPESEAEATFAAVLARRLDVKFHHARLAAQALSTESGGLEAAARAKRYEFLADAAKTIRDQGPSIQILPTIAVAHHMDDQAETVLMNLVRGSGLRGLGGMPWVRTLPLATGNRKEEADSSPPVKLVRPLLGVRRAQIMDYLDAFDLDHVEDRSNRDTDRLRNQIRHVTLPALAELNPQIVETLARTAQLLDAEADRADTLDCAALATVTVKEVSGSVRGNRHVLNLDQFAQLSLAAQRGTLRLIGEEMGLDARDLGFDKTERLLWQALHSQGPSGPHTLAGDVMWTVLAGSAERPPWLSIHRKCAAPIEPLHPHLARVRDGVVLPLTIDCNGDNPITPDWHLRCKTLSADELPVDWQQPGHGWRAFMDAKLVQSPLLTVPTAGMTFSPLGMPGQHKTLGDYFTDRKTPPALRPQWPILVDASRDEVIWVCGHTIAHTVRVTSSTQTVLSFEWVPAQRMESEYSEVSLTDKRTQCAQT